MKTKIINFAEKSGKSKEEKECCSNCNITYKDIKGKKNKLYKCYCGENICENCKENHLNEKDLEKHNMVEFQKKDYICGCKEGNQRYISYCLDCKKNLCFFCNKEHKKQKHKVIIFTESFQLGKEEQKEIKNKLKNQKEKIDKIKEII